MFKKIIVKGLIIFSISIILLTAFFGWFINADFRTVGERILDSVVTVEGSSGVVVYSEENMALVLTAYHTIEDEIKKTACTGCEYSFSVSVENKYYMGPKLITSYYPTYVYIDEVNDLAMIKIITNEKLNYSKISKYKA